MEAVDWYDYGKKIVLRMNTYTCGNSAAISVSSASTVRCLWREDSNWRIYGWTTDVIINADRGILAWNELPALGRVLKTSSTSTIQECNAFLISSLK